LRVARTFLEEWFAIWQDDFGQLRTREQAERRYEIWRTDAEATKVAPLRRQQQHLGRIHFIRLSAFVQNPAWEPTNNAAERGGRSFRYGQHAHFRLRLLRSIEAEPQGAGVSEETTLLLTSANTTSLLSAWST